MNHKEAIYRELLNLKDEANKIGLRLYCLKDDPDSMDSKATLAVLHARLRRINSRLDEIDQELDKEESKSIDLASVESEDKDYVLDR